MRAETSTGAAVTAFTALPFVFSVDTTAPSVPTLIRPASGDISNDNLPLFEWTPSAGDVVDYLLQVTSGDINTGPFDIDKPIAASTTSDQTVTPLNDATYRWQVIARDLDALNTATSDSRTFTVDDTPPGQPIPAFPVNVVLPTNTPNFIWVATGVEPVDEYRLQVTSGGSFNPPLDIEVLLSGDTTQFEVPTGDALADAVYQWRVIAGDAALNTASSITQSFTVDTTPPDPPALLLPGSGDLINDNTPFFQWASSPGDVAVFFLKVTSGDINTGPFDIDKPIAAPTTSDQTFTPLNDATYRWRVIASDLVGNTSDSGVRTFTIDTTPPAPAPVLGTPANGVSINDNTPFFAWSPPTGAETYLLQVTSGGSFNPPLDIEAVIDHPGTGHQTASPLNDALYQWRVIARDQLLNAAPSAVSTFTVDTTPPGVPSLVSPQDNAFLNDNTPFFDWTPVTGDVFDYLLHVTSGDINAGPFDIEVPVLAAGIPGTGHQAIAPLNDGVYQWQVIARDQVGNPQPYGIRTFTVDTIPPSPAPSLVQPASGDVSNDTNPSFQWTPSAGGVFDYLLQVTSGDINAGPFDIDIVVIHPGTSHQTGAPLTEAPYQWRVTARDRAGNPAPSLAGLFEVDLTRPGQSVLVLPVDLPARAAFLNDNTPFFDWNAPAGEAVASYRLLVASGDINTGPIFIDQVISGQLTSFQVQPVDSLPDGTYEWEVIASDIAENPNTSDTRSFVVDTLPPPAPPALIQPVGGDISNNVTPIFEWAPSSEDVFDYLLQVTSGGSFNTALDIEEVVLHSGTGHQANAPLNDSGYQWRVIARDAAFNTASSITSGFTVDTNPPAETPIPLLPPNFSFIPTPTPFFQWQTTEDVHEYELRVTSGDIVAGPFDIQVFLPAGSDRFQTPTGDALNDGTYQWRVIARDLAGNLTQYGIFTFTVDTVAPAPPPQLVAPPDLPNPGAFLNDPTPLFDWVQPPFPDGFIFDVFDYSLIVTSGDINAGPFDIEVAVPHPGTGHQAIAPLNDGVYQWRVTARDRALNTASSVARSFRMDTVTDPPTLLFPIGGQTIGDLTPTFIWAHSDPSEPVTYDILVTSDNSIPPFNQLFPNVGGLSFTPLSDLPVGATGTADYFWKVIATDSAGTGNVADSVAERFIINQNRPVVPVIISPLDKTSNVPIPTTFSWFGVALADFYDVDIATGDFASTPQPIRVAVAHSGDEADVQSALAQSLAPGTLYAWKVSGRDVNTGLTGDFTQPAAFITSGDSQDVILRVALEGNGDIVGPVKFKVRLYTRDAFGPDIAGDMRWRLFESTPLRTFGIELIQTGGAPGFQVLRTEGTIDVVDLRSGDRTFTLRLRGVAPGFFDITIEANHTLVNLRDDVPVHGLMGVLDMGTKDGPNPQPLLEGNAIDDPRPGVEPASIVNALDASLLAAAFGTSESNQEVVFEGDLKKFDRRADFDRDGDVDDADFQILKDNFLAFSPVIVVP